MTSVLGSKLKSVSRISLVLSILLIIFGILTITLPLATSIGIVLIVGWLVIFNGFTQLVHAFQSKGIGNIVWKILVALLYLVAGAYLVAHPGLGLAGFTLVLAFFLCAEGVTDVVAYFSTRKDAGNSPVDPGGWNHHPDSGNDDMETVAGEFAVGHWHTGWHQHGDDRHHPSHDELGNS